MSSPGHREREISERSQRSISPGPAVLGRSATSGSTRVERAQHRDRERSQRERQRSSSPSRKSVADGGPNHRKPRTRRHRKSTAGSGTTGNSGNNSGGEMVSWHRGGKRTTSHRGDVAMRQVNQVANPQHERRNSIEDEFDALAALHQEPIRRSSHLSTANGLAEKRSSTNAAVASSHEIDNIISQFREQCDVHMATLLELKNNITTTEKEVVVNTEKDKEFQQVRQWYSSLAEKHTKLQKEHQALQEEHVKLQERYMNLRRASGLHESFVADFAGEGGGETKKKKEKKDKGIGEIVWSRAVKPTGKAAGKMAGNVAGVVKNKMHKQLKEEE